MSDAVRTQIGIVEEVTEGTTPATPAFETLRVTVPSLSSSKQNKVSAELRPDRRIIDRIEVGFQAGGDIEQEASFGASDTIIRGNMMSEWNYMPVRDNHGTGASNITAVSATDVTILASDGSTYKTGVFAVGHLVRTSGFTAAGNNGLRRAGAGTGATTIKLAGGTIDAAPAAAARAKAIGFEGAAGDITATATGIASTLLDFTTLGMAVGQWVWVGGPIAGQQFINPLIGGWCRISAIAAAALTFDILPSTWGVDAGTAKTVRCYFGDYIREGTTRRSYTIEQQFQDLVTPTYEYYKGMKPTTMEWDVKSQDILKVRTTFMGMTVTDPAAGRFAGATDVAASTNDVMNASDNVGSVLVNGAVLGANFVTSLTLTVDNNGRRVNAVGYRASAAIRTGRAMITGKIEMYYDDATILTYIRNNTAVGFFFPISDPGGTKAYIFDTPRVKFGDGSPTVPGIDTDRMLPTEFTALRHPTLGYELHLQRIEEYNT
jgi:hypothetical protein